MENLNLRFDRHALVLSEDKAPFASRLVGGILVIGSIVFFTVFTMSFFGPGTLFAMREAGDHLNQVYGSSGGNWSMSVSQDTHDSTLVTVTYQHGTRSGVLIGKWDGEKYVFSEKNKSEQCDPPNGYPRHASC